MRGELHCGGLVQSKKQQKSNGGYIVGPKYDIIFFIGSPLVAVAMVLGVSALSEFGVSGSESVKNIFFSVLTAFVFAHLFNVVFRSYGNRKIFSQFRLRFIAVPLCLIAVMTWSSLILAVAMSIAVLWLVYHTAMQTFGLGRLYDIRAGNSSHIGRGPDVIINLLICCGPLLAGGIVLVDFFDEVGQIGAVQNSDWFQSISSHVLQHKKSMFLLPVGIISLLITAYYIYANWRLYKKGYNISWQKVTLLVTTAYGSIFVWLGETSLFASYLIYEFFHAAQYFAIVWFYEKKNIQALCLKRLGTDKIALLFYLMIAVIAGSFYLLASGAGQFLIAILVTVELMHYWWDGFIWSVQKKQIS